LRHFYWEGLREPLQAWEQTTLSPRFETGTSRKLSRIDKCSTGLCIIIILVVLCMICLIICSIYELRSKTLHLTA
jgi:hypothetical protein